MSTWEMPVRKKGGRALPVIVGGAFAVVVGVGALVLPRMLGGDGSEGVPAPEPSGTLAPTSSPGASDGSGAELPPLVGEATRASIFNDSSLVGIDLGDPVAVAPDLDFPVYALTDEVRAAMGPGWGLWLAYGDGTSPSPSLLISSPGGTVFAVASLGGITLDDEGMQEFGGVSDWFPPAQQAFVFVNDVDWSDDRLIDLRTGSLISGPTSSGGWGGGSWRLVGTRDDGTQVWTEYYGGDGAPEETWNLKGIELRSPNGEWRSVDVDVTGLDNDVVMDPSGTYAVAFDYKHTFASGESDFLRTYRDVAVVDTVTAVRTDYQPQWPLGVESCHNPTWFDGESFRVECWVESVSSAGSGELVNLQVFLDGSEPLALSPDPYIGLDSVGWRSPSDGMVTIRNDEGPTGIAELDLDRGDGRVRILDLPRLAETPGLEAEAASATSFEVWGGVPAGGSLLVAEGAVGTMRFCVVVDIEALTYDVVSLGPEEGQRGNRARRCGEWETAYYDWP